MCSKEHLLEERVEGAETLAYLMEPDVELQRIASTTDHLLAMLADYFKYPSSVSAIADIKRVRLIRLVFDRKLCCQVCQKSITRLEQNCPVLTDGDLGPRLGSDLQTHYNENSVFLTSSGGIFLMIEDTFNENNA